MVVVHSTQNELDRPSHEQLLSLSVIELRRQCKLAGIDDRLVDRKDELIAMMYNSYRTAENDNFEDRNQNFQITDSSGSRRSSRRGSVGEDTLRIVEELQQMILYYSQGDLQSDKVVRDTIRRLPREALEARDMYGNTLTMLACRSRACDLVQLLISKGTDINVENNDGATPLHFACYTDSLSVNMAQLLLNNGAKAEVTENQYGCTPLHWAASAGDLMLCRMLCDAGADPTTVDSRGYDPVAYAQQGKSLRCSEYLLEMRSVMKGRSAVQIFDENDLEPGWERNADFQSGQTYYYDTKRGVSLWEDEYYEWLKAMQAKRNLNGSLAAAEESASGSLVSPNRLVGDKSSHRSSQEVTEVKATGLARPFIALNGPPLKNIRTETTLAPMVSPNAASDSNTAKHVELDTVESDGKKLALSKLQHQNLQHAEQNVGSEGLSQPRMHTNDDALVALPDQSSASKDESVRAILTKEAFEDRLASLQEKMENQLNDQLKRIEEKFNAPKHDSQEQLSKSNEAVSEMSARIIKLQTDVGSKELEILSLRREVANLDLKLASCVKSSLSALEKLSDDGWWSPQKVKATQRELEAMPKELGELQVAKSALTQKLDDANRELITSSDKNIRLEKKIQALDIALDEENFAKEKAIRLLEQSKKGVEIDRDFTKSLEEAGQREKESCNKLRSELVAVEEKAEMDRSKILKIIDDKNKQLTEEREKVLKIETDFKEQQRMLDEEIQQSKDGQNNALQIFQSQLIDERMNKMENEALLSEFRNKIEDALKEKHQAILEMEEAKKNMREEIDRIQGLQGMINDAKLLMSRNEQLSRELHVETDRRKELHNKLEDLKGRIRVYVRLRPLSRNEIEQKCDSVLLREDKRTCTMFPESEDNAGTKTWDFDHIFCGSSPAENTQEAVFHDTRPLVTSAVDGVNVCIFAYGQTGSGKTFTMFGRNGIGHAIDTSGNIDVECGLAPRAAEEVFKVLQEKEGSSDASVCVSMFELYTDVLRDLLAEKESGVLKIKLAEHSESGMVEVENTVKANVKNARELLQIFKKGAASRTTSSTKMNADSSRSHLVTMIVTCVKNRRTGNIVRGKLTLVDLAGSERVSKSGAAGQQLREAQSINKSLSALGDVINALTSGSKHIPYRNHPLTMLMSDSLGGNAKTLMFVCCSPASYNRSESICALDFAKRCKDIKNSLPGVNKDLISEVRSLRAEVAKLKKERDET